MTYSYVWVGSGPQGPTTPRLLLLKRKQSMHDCQAVELLWISPSSTEHPQSRPRKGSLQRNFWLVCRQHPAQGQHAQHKHNDAHTQSQTTEWAHVCKWRENSQTHANAHHKNHELVNKPHRGGGNAPRRKCFFLSPLSCLPSLLLHSRSLLHMQCGDAAAASRSDTKPFQTGPLLHEKLLPRERGPLLWRLRCVMWQSG